MELREPDAEREKRSNEERKKEKNAGFFFSKRPYNQFWRENDFLNRHKLYS